jgi:hypothetical protein
MYQKERTKMQMRSTFDISRRKHSFDLNFVGLSNGYEIYLWVKFQVEIL